LHCHLNTNRGRVTESFFDETVNSMGRTHKALNPRQLSLYDWESAFAGVIKTFSWSRVRISATMDFAMKGMFLSCPDASKARRTFMNPSDTSSILRIGLLLVLFHPSPMNQAPISL
jgi:hypothetical protein